MFGPLLDLIFPPRCLLCGCHPGADQAGVSTCSACLSALPAPSACCRRCGCPRLPPYYPHCPYCGGRRLAFEAACTVGVFRGKLKKTVHDYKYGGRMRLATPLGRLVARQVESSGWPRLSFVVPVPLHPEKRKERGFDQALLLAEAVSTELGVPLRQALQRTRPTLSQTRLSAEERWRNVEDAFSVPVGMRVDDNVLLVDDLLTTGATAHNAARCLAAAGAKMVYLAVVAAAGEAGSGPGPRDTRLIGRW